MRLYAFGHRSLHSRSFSGSSIWEGEGEQDMTSIVTKSRDSTTTMERSHSIKFKFQDCVVGTREIQELQKVWDRQKTGRARPPRALVLSLFSCQVDSSSFPELIALLERLPIERLEFGGSLNFSCEQLSALIASTPSCRAINVMSLDVTNPSDPPPTTEDVSLASPTESPLFLPTSTTSLSSDNPFHPVWNHCNLKTLHWSDLDGSSPLLASLARSLPQLPQLTVLNLSFSNLTTKGFCTLVQEGIVPSKRLRGLELNEVRFGSLDRNEGLPALVQLLFDSTLVHVGISGFHSLFAASQERNTRRRMGSSPYVPKMDLPTALARLGKTNTINSNLELFTLHNIDFMPYDVTNDLLTVLLTQCSRLKTLSWTENVVSLLPYSTLLMSQLQSNLSLTYFACQKSFHRSLLPKDIQLWLQGLILRNRNWARVQDAVEQRRTVQDSARLEQLSSRLIARSNPTSIQHVILPALLACRRNKDWFAPHHNSHE